LSEILGRSARVAVQGEAIAADPLPARAIAPLQRSAASLAHAFGGEVLEIDDK